MAKRNEFGSVYSYETKTKGELWGAVAEYGYDWETGRRKQIRQTGFGSKSEAVNWLVARLHGRRTGAITEPSMMPLGQWLNDWLELRSSELRDSSIAMYRRAFKWFSPLHEIPLSRLTVAHIERECARLIREKHASSSVARAKDKLSTAMRAAVRAGMVTTNPVSLAEGPSGKSPRRQALTFDEANRLLSVTAGDGQWHLLWRTMLETWVRLGEVIELRWQDLDLERGLIHIDRSQTIARVFDEKRGRMITTFRAGPPKTDESVREIPISFDLMRRLHEHRTLQKRQAADLDREWSTTNLVFPNQSGGWLDRSKVGEPWLSRSRRMVCVIPVAAWLPRRSGIRKRSGSGWVMPT